MKFIVIFLLVFTSALAKAQEGWVTHTEERISVKFPSKPAQVAEKSFAFIDKDSVTYLLDVMNLERPGFDSIVVKANISSELFAYRLRDLFEEVMETEFEYPVEGKWNGFQCYTSHNMVHGKKDIYTYTILIGTYFYDLVVFIPEGRSTKGKDLFFSSATLEK